MKDLQTIIGLFIVLVIILSMGLQFSRKNGIETMINKGQPKTPTPNTPTPNTPTPNTASPNSDKFTTMAHMNMFDDTPAYY